jgi:hypothetical protein
MPQATPKSLRETSATSSQTWALTTATRLPLLVLDMPSGNRTALALKVQGPILSRHRQTLGPDYARCAARCCEMVRPTVFVRWPRVPDLYVLVRWKHIVSGSR